MSAPRRRPSSLRVFAGATRARAPRPAVWTVRAGGPALAEVSVWLSAVCPHPRAVPDPSGRTGLWLRVRQVRGPRRGLGWPRRDPEP